MSVDVFFFVVDYDDVMPLELRRVLVGPWQRLFFVQTEG
jgi:thiamine phosphate synthase YjbQ (UPF0047 family)